MGKQANPLIDAKEWGRRIRQARIEAGYGTSSAAAEASGVHFVNLSQFETGARVPSLDTLHRLLTYLRLDPAILFPERFTPSRPTSKVSAPGKKTTKRRLSRAAKS